MHTGNKNKTQFIINPHISKQFNLQFPTSLNLNVCNYLLFIAVAATCITLVIEHNITIHCLSIKQSIDCDGRKTLVDI